MLLISLGTRPEAIKLAPVLLELRRRGIDHRLLFTGQHRELALDVLRHFEIEPDIDLEIMTEGQTPSQVAARVLERMDEVFDRVAPTWVMVQGDTTTAMATALAAFHRKIAVAHVEAGLRSGVADDPFPEEMNRRLVGRLAALHFAPTERNRSNLLAEGVDPSTIEVVGNTVIDAVDAIMASAGESELARAMAARGRRMVLLTTHRRENIGERQRGIFTAVNELLDRFDDLEVVYPIHPNPAVRRGVEEHLRAGDRLHLIEPLDYARFLPLLAQAWLALTDSGGLQEEAPALGVPTLVLRATTERPELIESGSGRLVGVEPEAIVDAVAELRGDNESYGAMAVRRFPFGEGGAAARIVNRMGVAIAP